MEIEIDLKISLEEYEKLDWADSEKDLIIPLKNALTKQKKSLSFQSYRILKKSIDARKKPHVFFVFKIAVQNSIKNDNQLQNLSIFHSASSPIPQKGTIRPVVVGFGPAGIFTTLCLSEAGFCPIILERGKQVSSRLEDVFKYFETGQIDEESNVQFGEGGAGTFSDGKLYSGVKDQRRMQVLETFVRFGANKNICSDSHPHIGTDKLQIIVPKIRKYIESLGGTFYFSAKMLKLKIKEQQVEGVFWKNLDDNTEHFIQSRYVVLAIGHSARDTFRQLYMQGICMQKKPFSVGVRIENLQSRINQIQYGSMADHPLLPPAEYKLVSRLEDGKKLYTFCMCPGGQVIASASSRNEIVTNGMSYSHRDGKNANSAILVSVLDADLVESPLSGIDFQEKLEYSAFVLGGGNGFAPCQRVEDFLADRNSESHGKIIPTYRPGVKYTNLRTLFSERISQTIICGLRDFNARIPGFADEDVLLTGVETRSSSPVRILRDECFSAVGVNGLFPIGEGAGYAGGIMSSAIDGIKCADFILSSMKK